MEHNMNFRESLPEGCPPAESEQISSARDVFRVIRSNPPTWDDFRSQRDQRPEATFNVSECQARGLSVFADRSGCDKVRKLPRFRGTCVCRVGLDRGAGQILHTGPQSHHTWWPSADFDILARCCVEGP